MTDERDTQHAANAREIADSGARADTLRREVSDLIEGMRNSCFQTFAVSPLDDTEGFKLTRMYLQVLEDIEGRLIARIEKGSAATQELSKMSKLN